MIAFNWTEYPTSEKRQNGKSETRWVAGASGVQLLPSPGEVMNPSRLLDSSSLVGYILLGERVRDAEQYSAICVEMTKADLHSVDTFKQALTQCLQHATKIGMTHYHPYLGGCIMSGKLEILPNQRFFANMCFSNFPIPSPGQGTDRSRWVLRIEPMNGGQLYSTLPEECDPSFPAKDAMQGM